MSRVAGRDELSVATLVIFAATSMPLSLLAIGVFMFLPVVYSALGEISMAEAGMVILVTRLWDFVTDPLIGWLSDHDKNWMSVPHTLDVAVLRYTRPSLWVSTTSKPGFSGIRAVSHRDSIVSRPRACYTSQASKRRLARPSDVR